ncbi:MAG TPA: RHS repeat domain-containing protein [Candidatus Elarobacter sp.]
MKPAHGVAVQGPEMLRPSEIDRVLSAARRRAALHHMTPSAGSKAAAPAAISPGQARGAGGRAPGVSSAGAVRRVQTLPTTSIGTGIKPWWAYHEEGVPGGGHVMANMATGNVVLYDDDMRVPHKGFPLVFRRTYNSQSQHDIAGSDGTPPSLYGNGWTNTYDAHISGDANNGTLTIWDADGARYDYTGSDSAGWTPPAGQHATLAFDNSCGYLWTNKSGATYYFFESSAHPATCPNLGTQFGGYYGRIYQIIGRNRNVVLSFTYSWDNGDSSATGRISQITVRTESGLVTTMNFVDVAGHRVLGGLWFPDGVTYTGYGYDTQGNLNNVSRPPNNNAGGRPAHSYGYVQQGSGGPILSWADSPRWTAGGPNGAVTCFAFTGSTPATATLSAMGLYGTVNPVIADGISSGALQAGHPTGLYEYYDEFFTTGVPTPTFRDSDGHATNWVVDANGRATQIQTLTGGTNYLTENLSWDAGNDLVAFVDPRGHETDVAYDAAGNPVAVAKPSQYQGYSRPTTLIDYDGFSNVTAVCDPVQVHSAGADWSGQYSAGLDTYCSSSGQPNHVSFHYTNPTAEPYGELASVTSASGYTRTISYDASPQGGADYGLPTHVTGAPIQQFDQTTKQSSSSSTYDAHGNIVCAQTDAGSGAASITATSVMTYDALNRLTASADADDASVTGACAKSPGIAGSTIVNTVTYYPDGSPATTRTPSQTALGYGTVYSYDADGNTTSVAPYYPNAQSPQTAGVKRWFDGAGRLIETQEPADPGTTGDIPIALRYLYDLSYGGSTTTLSGATVTAHGGLFDVVKNGPSGWIDFKYSAYDAAGRLTNAYAFAPCPAQPGGPSGAIYCSQPAYATRYDWDSSALNPFAPAPGLLVATLDGVGAARLLSYDGLNQVYSVNYSGDGGVTTPVQYAYDFDGRLSDAWNYYSGVPSAPSQNRMSYTYSADGMLAQKANPQLGTIIAASYYPDATLAGVSATTTKSTWGDTVNQPNLYRYAYRNDGLLANESFGVTNQSVSWSYTREGRMTSMTDFGGSSPSIAAQYADGHGRLSSYTTPNGTYGSFVYDSEGRMTRYTDPYTSVDGEVVSSTYNIRGDLVGRTFSGGAPATKPGFQYKNIQGVLVQNATDQYDGRTGAILVTYDWGAFSYDQVGRLTSGGAILRYDAENRLASGDTFNASTAADDDCHSGGSLAPGLPPPKELTYLYDAGGQLFQDQTPGGTLRGQPLPNNVRQWLWDGSTPLYTMSMSANQFALGFLLGYAADGLGSVTADGSAPGLTISDPDLDGTIAQYHNNSGHSTWSASNVYNQFCQHANPLPASFNYVGPSNSAVPDDQTSDSGLTITSIGRGYLSRSMGFTTPNYSSATPYSARSTSGSSKSPGMHADASCPSGVAYDDTGQCSVIPGLGRVTARAATDPPVVDVSNFPIIYGGWGPNYDDVGWEDSDLHGLGINMAFGSVYYSTTDPYIGRTQNFAQRAATWARGGRMIEQIPGTANFTKWQDRCLEGFLIATCGTRKNGGRLNNRINGVNPKTAMGRAMLTEGADLFESLGLPAPLDDVGQPIGAPRVGIRIRLPRLFFP